jgi:hypothetical protein
MVMGFVSWKRLDCSGKYPVSLTEMQPPVAMEGMYPVAIWAAGSVTTTRLQSVGLIRACRIYGRFYTPLSGNRGRDILEMF